MEKEKEGLYIYQPYGIQDESHWAMKRIYAIAGLSILTEIKGLTKKEAEAILEALKEAGE